MSDKTKIRKTKPITHIKKLNFHTERQWSQDAPGKVEIILKGKHIGRIWVAFLDSEITSYAKWFKPIVVHGCNGKSMESNLQDAKKHVREYLKQKGKI